MAQAKRKEQEGIIKDLIFSRSEEPKEFALYLVGKSEFTFPDDHRRPTQEFQFSPLLGVPFHVLCQLLAPEITVGQWYSGSATASMEMPKTAMDEYRLLQFGENNIWPTGKTSTVEGTLVASGSHKLANDDFWGGSVSLDAGH